MVGCNERSLLWFRNITVYGTRAGFLAIPKSTIEKLSTCEWHMQRFGFRESTQLNCETLCRVSELLDGTSTMHL